MFSIVHTMTGYMLHTSSFATYPLVDHDPHHEWRRRPDGSVWLWERGRHIISLWSVSDPDDYQVDPDMIPADDTSDCGAVC